MALECYGFQADAIAAVEEQVASLRGAGKASPRVALVAPTGSGKTAAMGSEIVKARLARGERGVWVSPGPSLVAQAATGLLRAGVTDLGVISAGLRPVNLCARLQVVSIHTVRSRDLKPGAGFVVWDECHRMTAKTWRGFLEAYPDADHVGLTATLYGDGGDVEAMFDAVVVASTCEALVRDGAIAPAVVYCPPVDKASALLARYGGPSQSLVFCPSHADAAEVMEDLAGAGLKGEKVLESTTAFERRRVFARLEEGRTDVVVGCDTFVDGVDFIRAARVLFRHKVASRRKAFQAIGRVRRTRASVTDGKRAVVIDPHRSMVLHGMPDDASSKSASSELTVCESCFLLGKSGDPCLACVT